MFVSLRCSLLKGTALKLRENWRREAQSSPAAIRYAGFTMIELSIVLVIIGLLIGGVVVGRDLIEIAKARALMNQMQGYEAAYNTFRVKYNCLPGDCIKATILGLGDAGNGDKYVGSTTTANSTGRGCATYSGWDCVTTRALAAGRIYFPWFEIQDVWVHLSRAELIAGKFEPITEVNNPGGPSYTTSPEVENFFPKSASGKTFLIPFTWNGKLYVRTGMQGMFVNGPMFTGGNSAAHSSAALKAMQMKYISDKLGNATIGGRNADGYSNAAAAGQRVFATGLYTTSGAIAAFTWQQGDGACFKRAGPADLVPYQYNLSGYCDLLWQMN